MARGNKIIWEQPLESLEQIKQGPNGACHPAQGSVECFLVANLLLILSGGQSHKYCRHLGFQNGDAAKFR